MSTTDEQVIRRLERERDALRAERDELQASLDLRLEADRRAIKRWQEATGQDMTWPDHADLVVWLRAENERLRKEVEDRKWDTGELGCSEKYAALADEWLTHDSTEPPADLAPAQFVYWNMDEDESVLLMGFGTVDEAPWKPGLRYRPALSASGLPLCSAEGLDTRTRYVAFQPDSGRLFQFARRPTWYDTGWAGWFVPVFTAPETRRRPGPAEHSLMEVHRD